MYNLIITVSTKNWFIACKRTEKSWLPLGRGAEYKDAMFSLELPLINVEVTFEVENPKNLPRHLFSSLRGALGANLKRISCVARRYSRCLECPLNQHCAYGYIFETPRPQNADRLRLYPYLPHPFTITPPYPTPKESNLTIGLTLVGRAIQYFPHFVLSLEAAGKKGLGRYRVPLELKRIQDTSHSTSLYTPDPQTLTPPDLISTFDPEPCSQLKLSFLTPLSLKFQDKVVEPATFSFHVFIRNLLRRISALSYFHVGKELELDFKGLINQAQDITTLEKNLHFVKLKRYSARTKQEMPLQGLVGTVTFQGNLTPFIPFIKAGSLVHVGKSTSFGLGHFTFEFLQSTF